MTNFYVAIGASDYNVTVKRYMNGAEIIKENEMPAVGTQILLDNAVLGTISEVVHGPEPGVWTLKSDSKLPFILLGTVLTIGIP